MGVLKMKPVGEYVHVQGDGHSIGDLAPPPSADFECQRKGSQGPQAGPTCKTLGASTWGVALGLELGESSHIGQQHVRNHDTAVALLVIF
jgi:hypothetical protein